MRGKKVKITIICAALVLAICVVLVLVVSVFGTKNEAVASDSYGQVQSSPDDSGWKQVTSDQASIENDNILMVMDASTGHFSMKDKAKNITYDSAVVKDLKDAKIERTPQAQSELIAYYYDENGLKKELNSYQNSVSYKTFRILTNGSAIRVYYTLQLEETPPFVPQVLTDDMMTALSEKLNSDTFFKVKLMYKYYLTTGNNTDAKKMKSRYPYLEKNNLYILKDNISNNDRKAMSNHIKKAAFDESSYYEELDKLEITLPEEDVPLQFLVPVEYELTDSGFTSRVLTDLISITNEDFTLQSVALLPYFNCGIVQEEKGFWLLPDGSGSVMNINKTDNKGYSQKIYGRDLACANQITNIIDKNAVMPVMGFSSNHGSWFARINQAAEIASVNAYRAGDTEYATHGYAEFAILSTDSYKMRKSGIEMAVFSKEYCVEQPEVTYVLLEKNAGIKDMADCYQKMLKDENILKKVETGNNLYLDFTGYITEEASFMGVSYDKKVVLSTIKGIKNSVNKLIDDGIKNIYVRLIGYSDGGKYHGLVNDFSLDSDIGSMEELEELADILENNGGALYLEDDFYEVYQDRLFDGFSSTSDAIRAMDKTIVDISSNDIVTGDTDNRVHVRYITSPKLYKTLSEQFMSALTKKTDAQNIYVSIGNAGRYLISDFYEGDQYDRVQSRNATLDAIQTVIENGSFMTNIGNEYVLEKAEHILNMPMADSAYSAENFHIPFYQIVLNGYCNYSGEAINSARNIKKNKIWTVLSGANPYYSCVTEKEALEELKGDQEKYPMAFDVIYDDIKKFGTENQDLYEIVNSSEITGFEILEDGLYKISYGEQTVLFNETDAQIKWNHYVIEANNYVIAGK